MVSAFFFQKMNRWFDAYDVDGDGVLTMQDFEQSLVNMVRLLELSEDSPVYERALQINQNHWQHLLSISDQNRDHQITRDEFINWAIMAYQQRHVPSVEQAFESWIIGIFELLDVDGNGTISKQEYATFYQAHPAVYVAEQVDEIWDHLDTNHDGRLSFGEAFTMMLQFFFSDNPVDAGNWIYGKIE